MKKFVGILEFISKLCAAVIMMEIAANTYICVSTGFRWTWTWTDFQDMVFGYPLILGAAWVAFHADSLWDKAVGLIHKGGKKPQFIVTKGGDLERP